jgi:hypothetical protein
VATGLTGSTISRAAISAEGSTLCCAALFARSACLSRSMWGACCATDVGRGGRELLPRACGGAARFGPRPMSSVVPQVWSSRGVLSHTWVAEVFLVAEALLAAERAACRAACRRGLPRAAASCVPSRSARRRRMWLRAACHCLLRAAACCVPGAAACRVPPRVACCVLLRAACGMPRATAPHAVAALPRAACRTPRFTAAPPADACHVMRAAACGVQRAACPVACRLLPRASCYR